MFTDLLLMMILVDLDLLSAIVEFLDLTLYPKIVPFDTFGISCRKMEHLLFWSKCSIFHNIFKSIQNKI